MNFVKDEDCRSMISIWRFQNILHIAANFTLIPPPPELFSLRSARPNVRIWHYPEVIEVPVGGLLSDAYRASVWQVFI
jgi:hypothetical protein